LIIPGIADSDYTFDVEPFDKYENRAEVEASDINLKVNFPTKEVSGQNIPVAA